MDINDSFINSARSRHCCDMPTFFHSIFSHIFWSGHAKTFHFVIAFRFAWIVADQKVPSHRRKFTRLSVRHSCLSSSTLKNVHRWCDAFFVESVPMSLVKIFLICCCCCFFLSNPSRLHLSLDANVGGDWSWLAMLLKPLHPFNLSNRASNLSTTRRDQMLKWKVVQFFKRSPIM